MTLQQVVQYMTQYGNWYLFIIVYLEYLNLPGLPAGIIMPAAGILIAMSDMKFTLALIISVIAGLLGSYTLYAIGYYVGKPMLEKTYNKYPRTQPAIDKSTVYVEKYGNRGIVISRLIPVARTLISLVAGAMQIRISSFTLYSTIGIAIWNFGFIFAGYIMGKIIR
ncbi:MAG: DedA family protein [Cellulosilyticaceae bacterium]